MNKKLFILIIFCAFATGFSQTYKITYKTFFEGKEQQNQDPVIAFVNTDETWILSEEILNGNKVVPYEIQKIKRNNNLVEQFAFLQDNAVSAFSNPNILNKYPLDVINETKKILGYTCKKAATSINSNSIEVWYTNDLTLKGGPSLLGQNLGLVLEIVRNGNTSTKAVKIEKIKHVDLNRFFTGKKIMPNDELSHKDLLWKSRFTTISVFENEIINFSDESKSNHAVLRFGNGTVILKKVKFPETKETQNIFIQLTEQSNGDAYDRTGSVFLIPQTKETSFFDAFTKGIDKIPAYENGNGKTYRGVISDEKFDANIELMRFFTPFGIEKFNSIQLKDKNWHDKVSYRQDISEFKNLLSGKEYWIGVFIGNYDKGGHKISLEFTLHNEGLNVFKNTTAIPLFNTLNVMEMNGQDYATMFSSEKGLFMDFELKKNIKNAQLRFITTGHGGWENGDEFIPKENRIILNGSKIHTFTPWRTDCGSYRLYNPVSGNFPNGLSSSDLSRSNWCPGTLTNPVYIHLGDLKAGKHTLQIQIPQGENEGNSFCSWNVSGILIGNE